MIQKATPHYQLRLWGLEKAEGDPVHGPLQLSYTLSKRSPIQFTRTKRVTILTRRDHAKLEKAQKHMLT